MSASVAQPMPDLPPDVVGLGECSLDTIGRLAALPARGAKTTLESLESHPGGTVATAVLGCARLGLRGALVSSVGDDAAGLEALAPLEAAGIDLTGVERRAGVATRAAFIAVEASGGERTVLAYRNPALALEPAKLDRRRFEQTRAVLIDAVDLEASLWAARIARAAGVPVVLDADALWPEADVLLREVDFPVVSLGFAEEFGGSLRGGLALMVELGARLAVVTLAAHGAVARDRERELRSPAFPVAVRDATGAGDAFHAGLIFGLLEGLEGDTLLRVANAVAALNCGAEGAQKGLPTPDALEHFLANEHQTQWREPG